MSKIEKSPYLYTSNKTSKQTYIMKHIQIIAFDADDTLWVNEPYFQETEAEFCKLMSPYLPAHQLSEELFKTETQNMPLYGYGVKAYTLSMIETALRITENKIDPAIIQKIIDLEKYMLSRPVEVLDGVKDVLCSLEEKYKLVVATKGDLLDQERKLENSGLKRHFHHIEIMSDKQIADYQKLINQLNCNAQDFLMIGNSFKSDILPILEIGGYATYIPYHVTWVHEKVDDNLTHPNLLQVEKISEITQYL